MSSAIEELRDKGKAAREASRRLAYLSAEIKNRALHNVADDLLAPVVEAAISLYMVILPHISEPMGHTYPGKGVVKPEQAYEFAVRYPEAHLVCAHWGGGLPFYALMPEVGRALANVYFDTAASHYLYGREVFRTVSNLVGVEKILLGSDFPLIRQSRAVAEVAQAGLAPEEYSGIAGDNAARLLGIGGTI